MRSREYTKRECKDNELAPANYLIICEGTKTEPNYFNEIKEKIQNKYKDKVDVLVPRIKVEGTGRNTISLADYTKRMINYKNKIYSQVWIVFDKDYYTDEQFNSAIRKYDYNVAWSNPSFELWLLSHFKRIDRQMTQAEAEKELDKVFIKKKIGGYNKNDKNIFSKVTTNGSLKKAIENCEYMEELDKDKQPAQRNPMTKVYKIVNELKQYIE